MATAVRNRLAAMLDGEVAHGVSRVQVNLRADDLHPEVEGIGRVRLPVTAKQAAPALGEPDPKFSRAPAETACEIAHKALPRKRHTRGRSGLRSRDSSIARTSSSAVSRHARTPALSSLG
jgi:hypothetical protein